MHGRRLYVPLWPWHQVVHHRGLCRDLYEDLEARTKTSPSRVGTSHRGGEPPGVLHPQGVGIHAGRCAPPPLRMRSPGTGANGVRWGKPRYVEVTLELPGRARLRYSSDHLKGWHHISRPPPPEPDGTKEKGLLNRGGIPRRRRSSAPSGAGWMPRLVLDGGGGDLAASGALT